MRTTEASLFLAAALAAGCGLPAEPIEPVSSRAQTARAVTATTQPCTSAPATPASLSSWLLAGMAPQDFEVVNASPGGQTLKNKVAAPADFGTLMQMGPAGALAGKRVKLSATLQATGVTGWAGLWMRVDGPNGVLAFDNMEDRPISGTAAAKPYEVILDVPANAVSVAFGVLLTSAGSVTASGFTFQETCLPPTASPWFLAGIRNAGDYQMTVVSSPEQVELQSLVPSPLDFGTAMQTVDATPYRGKRIRFSAKVQTAAVADWAGLWMRVDPVGGTPQQALAFDNMGNRALWGTHAATRYGVVLDVAANAGTLNFGVLLVGTGTVTLTERLIEEVPLSVPTTDLLP